MWNTEDVPIPETPKTEENDNHPGPYEQGLDQMAASLEQGIEARQSHKASTQGEPHDLLGVAGMVTYFTRLGL